MPHRSYLEMGETRFVKHQTYIVIRAFRMTKWLRGSAGNRSQVIDRSCSGTSYWSERARKRTATLINATATPSPGQRWLTCGSPGPCGMKQYGDGELDRKRSRSEEHTSELQSLMRIPSA